MGTLVGVANTRSRDGGQRRPPPAGANRHVPTLEWERNVGSTPEDPYSLQERAEHWQRLATRQQELAMQLRQLASDQRELANLWDFTQVDHLTTKARDIEAGLRALSSRVIDLEQAALDLVAEALAKEARLLKPE